VNVSRETFDRLTVLTALLEKWNPAINLVAKSTLPAAWTRHVVDSAQLYRLAPPHISHWADLGSGGGFPGLVITILSAELDPLRRMTLVESDQRKATFLRQAVRELGLTQATVLSDRIESVPRLAADVLSARALSALPQLCDFAQRHLAPTGLALFPKGAQHREEIAQAEQGWCFDLSIFPSDTDPSAVVLAMKAIQHV
jgi:16S rRNA (guanine527-N7)-methyltransferase